MAEVQRAPAVGREATRDHEHEVARRRWRTRGVRDADDGGAGSRFNVLHAPQTGARSGSRRLVVVHQDAVRRAFQIVELAAFERPPEQRADGEHEHDRERHEPSMRSA